MNKLQLVAETPRAGELNHRLLVAPDSNLSESEVAQLIGEARRNPQGENYLAVSVEVKQVRSNRTGTEILVLVGVNVEQLSDNQRKQVRDQLEQQFVKLLATLVTVTIDWSQEKHILIRREELANWERAFQVLRLPVIASHKKTLSQKPVDRFWLKGAVVVVLIGIFLLGWWMISGTSSLPPNPDDAVTVEESSSPASEEVAVNPAAMKQTKKLMAVFAAFQTFAEDIKSIENAPDVDSPNSFFFYEVMK